MRKLPVSSTLNLYHYPKNNLSEYIHKSLVFYKNMGFDAADFPTKMLPLSDESWRPVIESAIQSAEETGIRFRICHLPYGILTDYSAAQMEMFNNSVHRAIDAAALLGVEYAVVHPNTSTLPLTAFSREEQRASVLKHLEPFVAHGAEKGVRLVVENMRPVPSHIPYHRYCQDPEELCDIVDTLGTGVCWDFGHAHIAGLKQSEALSCIGSRLKVLHVNDNFAYGDDHVPPFCGTIDWQDAMKGLALAGFEGLLNYEIATKNHPAAVQESFAKYLLDAAGELLAMIP